MQKNAFGGRALPGPAGGAYSAPPGSLAGFKGSLREGKREGGKGESKGREGGGRERDLAPQKKKSWRRH